MTEIILTCADCGQKNRLPATVAPGKVVVCGRCKSELDLFGDGNDNGEESDGE